MQALLNTQDVIALQRVFREAGTRDTCELGTFYGGSAVLGAQYALARGTRHWCIDQFGRPDSKFPFEPSMEIAWAHLRAEDLHTYAVLVAGTTQSVGAMFADHVFGGLFIDSAHCAEWVPLDIAWADRAVAPGGLVALHGFFDDNRYDGYQAAGEAAAAEHGWTQAMHSGSTRVYQRPGTA
ncbi:MAG TPA: class I SAM-dependent methyltransferase [Vicinamibacterales bacterium]|nr:class I SAM-dependent methyltransferase [Vicinamibacterales bacterium]